MKITLCAPQAYFFQTFYYLLHLFLGIEGFIEDVYDTTMELTPIIALSSVMVTCFALSTAEATCCWCSCDRNGRICAIIAFNRFAISVWKDKKTITIQPIYSYKHNYMRHCLLSGQRDKNPTHFNIEPKNNQVNSYIRLWINKASSKGYRDRKIMSSQTFNIVALNKTRRLVNGNIIQRSIFLNKINITNQ